MFLDARRNGLAERSVEATLDETVSIRVGSRTIYLLLSSKSYSIHNKLGKT